MNEKEKQERKKQAWLLLNTLWCDGLQSRITPEQCAENRRRARSGEYAPIIGKHCPQCPGLDSEQLKNPDPARPTDDKTKTREPATRRCSSCRRKKPRSRFRRSKVTGNLLKRCLDCEGKAESSRQEAGR